MVPIVFTRDSSSSVPTKGSQSVVHRNLRRCEYTKTPYGPGEAFLSATLVDKAPRQVCIDRIKRTRLIAIAVILSTWCTE